MIFNIPLKRKDAEISASPCVVDKTVELSADAYVHFCRNLLADYDFIKDNVDAMYQDEDGVIEVSPGLIRATATVCWKRPTLFQPFRNVRVFMWPASKRSPGAITGSRQMI